MKRNSGAWLLSTTIAVALLLVQAACTSPNDAGKDVLPIDESVNGHYVDTFSIEMRTLVIDSSRTYMLSQNLFGNYVDDQFGHIFAATYIQPRVSGSNLTFGTVPAKLSLDSIVLTLDLVNFYGRYNDPIPIEIFEITESFPTDSSLYSGSRLDADTTIDLANGYSVDFSMQPGFFDYIGIRLHDSLGRKILFANPAQLASNDVFKDFLKGLLIRSKAVSQISSREPGGIFGFDPRSEKSFLTLHYKDSTVSNESKRYSFPINASSERFHSITRTDVGSRLLSQAVQSNGDPNGKYACIQAGALVNLYVGIPSIKTLNNTIINQANLILHVDPEFEGSLERFNPPSEIFLFISDSTHTKPANLNLINSSISYTKATHEYVVPMTNTIQQILAGRLGDDGFILVPGANGISLNRAVFGGPGHPTLSPRLEVIYTSLPGQ